MMLSSVITPVIIPEKGQSVNENSANIANNAQSVENSTHINLATTVTVKFCRAFNSSAQRMDRPSDGPRVDRRRADHPRWRHILPT